MLIVVLDRFVKRANVLTLAERMMPVHMLQLVLINVVKIHAVYTVLADIMLFAILKIIVQFANVLHQILEKVTYLALVIVNKLYRLPIVQLMTIVVLDTSVIKDRV